MMLINLPPECKLQLSSEKSNYNNQQKALTGYLHMLELPSIIQD